MTRAWPVVVAGVVLAPLVTWLPMLAARFPWLGLPLYPAAQGGDLWHMQAFWLVALGVIAVVVGQTDKWLGMAVLLVAAVPIFLRGATMDPTHSVLFALGALLLYTVRLAPRWITADIRLASFIRPVLIACGAFQIVYVLQQKMNYDLLWGPLVGGTLNKHLQPIGTLLGVDAVSSYIAILAPLMPLWLLPFALYVVATSQSLGAMLAAGVGLCLQLRPWTSWKKIAVASATLLVIVGFGITKHVAGKETQKARVGIWTFAATEYAKTSPVIGWGLGGWSQRVPQAQLREKYTPTNELFAEAHNEPLQWALETGMVGALLLGLWLWEHRRMFAHPVWGGSLAALASDSLSWHPFHIVSLALLGIVLIGLATHTEEPCAA